MTDPTEKEVEALVNQTKGLQLQDFKFWNTQPVPKMNEQIEIEGPIEPNKKKGEIQKDPYPLPDLFEWCVIDLNDESQCLEVYELLNQNYVEDDDAMFRFDYSAEFLKW